MRDKICEAPSEWARLVSQPYETSNSMEFKSLWAAQSGLCALCGRQMLRNRFEASHARIWAKRRATFDHIVPRSKGGSNAVENMQLAHACCNKVKGDAL